MTPQSIAAYPGGDGDGNVVDMTALRRAAPFRITAADVRALLPGGALCLAAAGIAYVVHGLVPGVSPLIIAIVLGVALANLVRLPAVTTAGVGFSAKTLLRAGIVFLGLQVVLTDIVDLGPALLLIIVCIVAGGILATVALGRAMGIPSTLTLLIACGFSICGAAAVAGAAGVVDPDDAAEDDTVTAVALVVIFGTLMIPLVPFVAGALDLSPRAAGMWAGGSIHEMAQVVAAGGVIGGGALTIAVVVKLARVVLLAPVAAILSIRQRRLSRIPSTPGTSVRSSGGTERTGSGVNPPPIVPPFVVGFVAFVLLGSFVSLPDSVLTAGTTLQTVLLSAAMFALGCGVTARGLRRVGLRPFALAALSTVLVSSIAFVGVTVTQ